MILRDLFENSTPQKVLCIFPGGFHPFHSGHASVYQYLTQKFPMADVFVASSNRTTERPFPFKYKQFLAIQAGIPKNRFVEVLSPYKAMEITKNYDPNDTVLIFALSEKDKDRLGRPFKKDGSPSYMQPFPGNVSKCAPFINHAYYVITPTIKFEVLGQPVSSASQIRDMYQKAGNKGRLEIAQDLYPNSKNIEKVKQVLDSVLGTTSLKESIFQKPILSEAERDMILQKLAPLYNIAKMPPIRLSTKKEKSALGHTLWTSHKIDSMPNLPEIPYLFGISINPLAARDKAIYRQVLAHELCHVEDIYTNAFPKAKENPDLVYDEHGPSWKKIANRINGQLGANYVSKFSDTTYSIFGNLKRGPSLKNIKESKTSSITSNGWYRPTGEFIGVRPHHHMDAVRIYGMSGYGDAYDNDWLRVELDSMEQNAVITTDADLKMCEKNVLSLIKRMQNNFSRIKVHVSDGTFEWDGKQLNKISNKMYEHIVKLKNGKYRLLSHKGKNLGTFDSHSAAAKHEGEVEYFKHMKESPDFSYTKYRNRERDFKNIEFKEVPTKYGYVVNALFNKKIVGYIDVITHKVARVIFSKIDGNWRGTGLGQTLYDKAIEVAKKKGLKKFMSDTQLSGDARSAWAKLSTRHYVDHIEDKDSDYFCIDLSKE